MGICSWTELGSHAYLKVSRNSHGETEYNHKESVNIMVLYISYYIVKSFSHNSTTSASLFYLPKTVAQVHVNSNIIQANTN
jgi:hypothetical protein